jgi:hypothetical protein
MFQMEKMISDFWNKANVFSAETLLGKEAEFINEKLRDKDKVIRFLRLLLISFYVLVIGSLIFILK